jgi:hypothetical protein
MVERPWCHSGEKHEPAGDIDTVSVDGLKALDPNRPIREADIGCVFDLSCIHRRGNHLCTHGAPEGLCGLSGGYGSGVSILCRHRRGRLDIAITSQS